MQKKNLNNLAVDLSKVQNPTTLDKETWEIKNEIFSEIIEAIYRYREVTNPIITLEEYIAEHLAKKGVMPKTKIKDLTLENAKLTDCVQDLLKDQDVLKKSLDEAREEKAKIFEEIEEEAYKNEEGDLYLDLPDYLKIKNKHLGE